MPITRHLLSSWTASLAGRRGWQPGRHGLRTRMPFGLARRSASRVLERVKSPRFGEDVPLHGCGPQGALPQRNTNLCESASSHRVGLTRRGYIATNKNNTLLATMFHVSVAPALLAHVIRNTLFHTVLELRPNAPNLNRPYTRWRSPKEPVSFDLTISE